MRRGDVEHGKRDSNSRPFGEHHAVFVDGLRWRERDIDGYAKRWHGHVYGAVAVERDRNERVGKHQRRDEYNL